MIQACYTASATQYQNVGALGIEVHPEWRNSFAAFWADMWKTYQPGLTLHRKDPHGNFTPENTYWAPKFSTRVTRKNRHGMSKHPAYQAYRNMLKRDRKEDWDTLVCEAWNTFEGFWEDMGPTYQDGFSLRRIDKTKDFGPDNCVWIGPNRTHRQNPDQLLFWEKPRSEWPKHRLYPIYVDMFRKCYDKTHPEYKEFGGKGITVDRWWAKSFKNFVRDLGVYYTLGLKLELREGATSFRAPSCRFTT
jgi:hypothetical protein